MISIKSARVGKRIQTTFIITLLVLSSLSFMAVQKASAVLEPQKIILPFSTGWERHEIDDSPIEGEAYGRTNIVDWKTSDFYGYYGSDNPLQPELGWRKTGDMGVTTPPDGTFFGFDLGSYYLMAAGYFGSSYSYCYFDLFDTTSDSDYQPPIKIRKHTFINIFYYHYQLGNCMIDAQLFNKGTREFWTLRDFNYNGEYVVDQNDVRIHPACRYNDPIGSWEFASFDLSIIYDSDPEDWYITKIWIGFDNDPSIGDGATGQARTYFDILTISYGLGDKVVQTSIPGLYPDTDNAWVSGSVIAWHSDYLSEPNAYNLYLKVLLSGFDDGYFIYPQTNWEYNLYPSVLKVTVNSPYAQAREYPEPTGVNLTQSDPDVLRSKVAGFVYDGCRVIGAIVGFPYGWVASIPGLANEFYGLLKTPEQEPTYEWPLVDWGSWNENPKNIAMGEVYMAVEGLTPGYHDISITLSVDYCYPLHIGMGEFVRHYVDTVSLELSFPWNSEPDELPNNPPNTPSTPSGQTTVYRNVRYTYSTCATDPDGDGIRYHLNATGPSNPYQNTTIWVDSGTPMSWNLLWEPTDSPGTYLIQTWVEDVHGALSGISSLSVTMINRAPNTPSLTGPTSGYVGWSYTYKACATDPDGDSVKYTFYWGDGSTTTTGYYGSDVEVSRSNSWSSTGTYSVKVKATDVYGAYKYSSSLTVTIYYSGGGCPMLYVWNGAEYVEEGLLDIHNPEGVDVIYEHTLVTTPQRKNGMYLLRLTEHPQTHSYIDEVKLYATLEDGTMIELPLIYAWHSEDGNVLPLLLHSDDWKAETLGADLNNGTSQSIDLKFASLSPNLEIVGFVFEIEGNNRIFKV